MPHLSGQVELDFKDALADLRAFRRELRDATKDSTRISLEVDFDGAKVVRQVRNDLKGLQKLGNEHHIGIGVTADTGNALETLREVKRELDGLGRNPRVTVHIDSREVSESFARMARDEKARVSESKRLIAEEKREREAALRWFVADEKEAQRQRVQAERDAVKAIKAQEKEVERARKDAARLGSASESSGDGGLLGKIAVGSFVGNMAAQLAQTGLSAIKDLGVAVLDFDRKKQQVLIGFQTQLGGSAKAARDLYGDLQHLNDLSPFKQEEFIPNAQKLLGAKVGLDDLKAGLRGVNEEVAALGGNGEKFSEISTALTQIWIKPHLQLEELTQQLVEHGVPAFDMLATAYGTNTTQIQKWISKGLIPGKEAYRALVNQMERQNFGAAEKQARSFDGVLSTLSDRMKRGLGDASKSAFDDVTHLGNRLVYISGNKDFQEWTGRVGKAVGTGFKFVKDVVFDSLGFVVKQGKRFNDIEFESLKWWVGAWKSSSGFVWDSLKWTARNLAWFADTSTGLIQKSLGGKNFFQNSLEGLIGGVEGKVAQGKATILRFGSDISQAWGEVYGGLDFGKLLRDSEKYADGQIKLGGKLPPLYAPKLGTSEADAAKARAAGLKAEKDMLGDLAKSYDAKAKAVVDSAKREVEALLGVRDALKDTFSDIQNQFVQFGIINDPMGPMLRGFEKLLDLGGKSSKVVSDARRAFGNFQGAANNARSRSELISGLDGVIPTKGGGLVAAGKAASGTLIESLVREFNDKSPRKLGASCADVASNVLNQIGNNLKYSPNARELMNNAKAAGWVLVPLGTAGSLNIQTGAGFGKVSHAHTTVGIGGGRVAGSSGYRFQEYDITHARGNPVALMPPSAKMPSGDFKVSGAGAGIGTRSDASGFDVASINGSLTSISAISAAWGSAVRNTESSTARFALQSKLATTEFQAQLERASKISGQTVPELVKRLRELANTADFKLNRVRAADEAVNSIKEQIKAVKEARTALLQLNKADAESLAIIKEKRAYLIAHPNGEADFDAQQARRDFVKGFAGNDSLKKLRASGRGVEADVNETKLLGTFDKRQFQELLDRRSDAARDILKGIENNPTFGQIDLAEAFKARKKEAAETWKVFQDQDNTFSNHAVDAFKNLKTALKDTKGSAADLQGIFTALPDDVAWMVSMPGEVAPQWAALVAMVQKARAAIAQRAQTELFANSPELQSASSQVADLRRQLAQARATRQGPLSPLGQQEFDWKQDDAASGLGGKPAELIAKVTQERDAVRGLMRDVEQMGKIDRLTDRVSGAFDSMFDSVLNRQKSFGAAIRDELQSTLQGMAIDIIKSRVRSLLAGLFTSALGGSGGDVARVASNSDIGPRRVDGSFAVGIDNLRKDGVYQLHAGETVLARDKAEDYRRNRSAALSASVPGSGSGAVVHQTTININGDVVTPDPAEFERRMANHANRNRASNRSRGEIKRGVGIAAVQGQSYT